MAVLYYKEEKHLPVACVDCRCVYHTQLLLVPREGVKTVRKKGIGLGHATCMSVWEAPSGRTNASWEGRMMCETELDPGCGEASCHGHVWG